MEELIEMLNHKLKLLTSVHDIVQMTNQEKEDLLSQLLIEKKK